MATRTIKRMVLIVNGVESAETTYSGTLQDFTNAVELFIANAYPQGIMHITTCVDASFDKLKERAHTLMDFPDNFLLSNGDTLITSDGDTFKTQRI